MSKEDIKKAKAENAERIANIAYSGGGHIGQDDLETAFENGAEWRINSVWHDASEAPQHSGMLLAFSKDGRAVLCGPNNSDWKTTVKVFHIVRWAYVDDLKPNTKD